MRHVLVSLFSTIFFGLDGNIFERELTNLTQEGFQGKQIREEEDT
jgi:hypothetical protein